MIETGRELRSGTTRSRGVERFPDSFAVGCGVCDDKATRGWARSGASCGRGEVRTNLIIGLAYMIDSYTGYIEPKK
jgi:hypothetical protein